MANYWNQDGIPHKGWILEDVIDVREDGQPEWETEYEICMMCGQPKIRYVHIVTHNEVEEEFRVGCNCAEKMTNDYLNPQKRERELRNKSNRRINWLNKNWKTSRNGNHFINYENHHLLIYRDKKTLKFRIKIGEVFGKKSYDDLNTAKIAVFNNVEYLKESNRW
uniref:hypothetical protein n=1 Tax=uncultured Draconibacterium sp. TaxID=1573823 RepID=UPI003217519A